MADQSNPTILDHLATALERAADYNHEDKAPPACILWPDKLRQWERVLPSLAARC